jgi:hypothetical protein
VFNPVYKAVNKAERDRIASPGSRFLLGEAREQGMHLHGAFVYPTQSHRLGHQHKALDILLAALYHPEHAIFTMSAL